MCMCWQPRTPTDIDADQDGTVTPTELRAWLDHLSAKHPYITHVRLLLRAWLGHLSAKHSYTTHVLPLLLRCHLPTYLPTYLRAIRKVWYNFIYTHRHGGAKHGIKWHSAVAIHRPWDCVLTRAMWRVPMQVDAYTRDHRGGQGAAWKEVLDDLQNAILHYHDTNADGTLATQEMADNIKRWLEVNSTGW